MQGMQVSNQYGQTPFLYINGFQISNDTVNPNTVINVSAGSAIDSTGTFQFISNEVFSCNILNHGLGGLDTGTFAAGVYAVYVIFDPVGSSPPGIILSLSYTQPIMPATGYSAFRLIGYISVYVHTGSPFILPAYWSAGNSGNRSVFYKVKSTRTAALIAGAATTPTHVSVGGLVPNVQGLMANYSYAIYVDGGTTADTVTIYLNGNSYLGYSYLSTGVYYATVPTVLLPVEQFVISGSLQPCFTYDVAGPDSPQLNAYVNGYYYDV